MSYSVADVVEAVGEEAAARFQLGDRVVAVAPHAQYVIQDIDAMEGTRVWPIPDDLTFEQAAFLPLSTGGVMWAQAPGIRPGDIVVILGQGLVGNLVMYFLVGCLHRTNSSSDSNTLCVSQRDHLL